MKKGFTLIELLVSIAILGIIMMIAVPVIGNVIDNSKNNAYLETVNTIENAAQLYRIRNSHEFSDVVGEKSVVTVEKMQEAGFLKYNMKDPRYGTTITDGDVFVVLQSNGEYTYTHTNSSYVKDNLVLWYDALWHGDNQNIWIDRSGNDLHGTLVNFNHTPTSGWQNDSLVLDGINDYVNAGNSPLLSPASFTVEGLFKFNSTETTDWMFFNRAVGGTAGSYYIYSGSYSSATLSIFSQTAVRSNASFATAFVRETYYHMVGTYDAASSTLKTYVNGELKSTVGGASFGVSTADVFFGKYTTGYQADISIKSARVHSRALSVDEIKQNYLTDKERFNF
jgi:prepilin-type N-terminal cleavage/methylation domain-containing protein